MVESPLPVDSGPIYRETLMGRWPVEPWNTWSTLPFLFITIYWMWRLGRNWRHHKIVLVNLIFIGTGFVGGFIYHSTRSHIFWLLLDWVPIVIDANIVSIYMWYVVSRRLAFSVFATYLPLLCSIPLYTYGRFNSMVPMSLSYLAIVLSVAPPFFKYSLKMKHKNAWMIYGAASSISVALLLRTFDQHSSMDIFPMGTHFLWHLLGAVTCNFLVMYVYFTPPERLKSNSVNTGTPGGT